MNLTSWLAVLALCWPHGSVPSGGDVALTREQAKLVKDSGKALKSSDEETSILGLQEIALLAVEFKPAHKKISEALALGFKNDSYLVRAETARLMVKSPHPDVIVKAFVGAADDIRGFIVSVSGMQKDEAAALDVPSARLYSQRVIEGLGQLPDDRSLKALLEILASIPNREHQRYLPVVAGALTDLAAWDGLKALMPRFGDMQSRDISRGAAKGPEKAAKKIHDHLASMARGLSLDEIPDYGPDVHQEWREWLDQHRKQFAVKLGRFRLPDED